MNSKGFLQIGVVLILVVGIAVAVYLTQFTQIFKPKASEPSQISTTSTYPPKKPADLRCITYFDFEYFSNSPAERDNAYNYMNSQIPIWKSNGFNCVAVVLNWNFMQPRAYPTPVWDEERVRSVTRMFDSLKNNNMGIMMGLNFVHTAPEGFNPTNPNERVECDFLRDATMYGAFERYTHEIFTRFQNYPMFYHVFTDNAYGCVLGPDPEAGSALMRRTIGSLPSRIPSELRSKIIIGFHDVMHVRPPKPGAPPYNQTAMSPVEDVKQFDFYSQQVYEGNSTIDEFLIEMDDWVKYMRNFFGPNMPPIIFGELGSTLVKRKPEGGLVMDGSKYVCEYDERSEMIQRNALYFMTKYAIDNKIGFSIWAWQYQDNAPDLDCQFGAHALTRPDGSLRPAVAAIKQAMLEGGVQLDTSASTGQISASPMECTLAPGQNVCKSTISWSTKNLSDVEVKVTQGNQVDLPFSSQASGSTEVPWITTQGAKFDLYGNSGEGKKIIQTITVKATNPAVSAPPSPSVTATPNARVGDLNNDGRVNIFDFNIFMQDYPVKNLRSDFNKNGTVDIMDFNLLLSNFNK